MGIAVCHPDDLRYGPISSGWYNVIWNLSHPDEIVPGRISSEWLLDTAVCHSDDISYHHMSSGWLSRNWYLIRMSYDNVVMSSGWHTLPFLSHPDEIANFDFPQHAVALQRFRKFPITIHLENLSTSTQKTNTIIVRRTKAQNTCRGMVQENVVYWMNLPNTPILWTTSVINCSILSQEISFRASQCYKCRLLVWGQCVSNFTGGFNQIIRNLGKSLGVMLTVGQAWQMELAPIFQYQPCATNHLLVNMDAFEIGQNLHWYTN